MDRALTIVPTEEIRALGGPGAFSRGSGYAKDGHVLRIVWHEIDQELVADVAGSTGLYQTTIAFDDFGDDEPGDIVYADCTCPVGGECKHCVAVLIVNNQRMLKQRTSAILEAGSAWESGEVDIDDFAVGGPSGYGAN